MQYIESNPVRASMVEHPGEYTWSSYSYNACGQVSFSLKAHPLYIALGRNSEERYEAYRELFSVVLGRSYFKDKIEEVTKRQVRVGQSGRPTGLLVQEQEGMY